MQRQARRRWIVEIALENKRCWSIDRGAVMSTSGLCALSPSRHRVRLHVFDRLDIGPRTQVIS